MQTTLTELRTGDKMVFHIEHGKITFVRDEKLIRINGEYGYPIFFEESFKQKRLALEATSFVAILVANLFGLTVDTEGIVNRERETVTYIFEEKK